METPTSQRKSKSQGRRRHILIVTARFEARFATLRAPQCAPQLKSQGLRGLSLNQTGTLSSHRLAHFVAAIDTPKQGFRLWFEFYKLALDDPALAVEVERTREFYEPWGDVRGQTFDRWWAGHSRLFEETRVREVSRIGKETDALYLAVPLQQPLIRSMRQVKQIVEARQLERAKAVGIEDRRTKAAGAGQFRLTPGVEFRHTTVKDVLLVYQVYLANEKPKINAEFLAKVQEFYRNRPRAKKVPSQLGTDPNSPDIESTLRSIRRYVERAEELMLAAARGEFPGKSRMGSRDRRST